MAKATAELQMKASPDAVWEVVRDFHGLGNWMPGIESTRSEGDDRVLSMMGMEVREHLVKLDDPGRAITYAITDGAPVETHEATITVHDDGTGSRGHVGRRRHARRHGGPHAGRSTSRASRP